METKIIRNPDVIKITLDMLGIKTIHYLMLFKINHIKKTLFCIVDFETPKRIKLNYNIFIKLI